MFQLQTCFFLFKMAEVKVNVFVELEEMVNPCSGEGTMFSAGTGDSFTSPYESFVL